MKIKEITYLNNNQQRQYLGYDLGFLIYVCVEVDGKTYNYRLNREQNLPYETCLRMAKHAISEMIIDDLFKGCL